MNPNENQLSIPQAPNPDQAAATLSFATQLSQHLMQPDGGQNISQDSTTTPPGQPNEQPKDPNTDIQGLEDRLMQELQTLREEMKTQADGNKELKDLKDKIEKILNESEQ